MCDLQRGEQIYVAAKKRKIEDFSEEERKIVFNERVLLSISKETVAERHDSEVSVVNEIIVNHHLKQQKEKATLKQRKMNFAQRWVLNHFHLH